jgi:ApaG protein
VIQFRQIRGLKVSVDSVQYDSSLSTPPDRPHAFVYHISIHNSSSHTVQLFGRKWVLRDASGSTLVVEGEGIVGQHPVLGPKQSFRYNSYHTIADSSRVMGAFFGITTTGVPICTLIPEFQLQPPEDA